jgi:hypothetical protein
MNTRMPRTLVGPSGTTAIRRTRGAWAALLLFAKVLGLLHLGTSPHLLVAGTGRVVHVASYAESPGGGVPLAPERQGRHDDCAVFAALTQASTPGATVSFVSLAGLATVTAVMPSFDVPPPSQHKLHRLSPSHSPPSVA